MAQQYILKWFAAPVMVNPNATGQQASWKARTSGTWSTAGFTPANPLLKTTEQVQTLTLYENIVWQFKVEALCTEGGPTINDNGIQEAIEFICMVPNLTFDKFDATINFNMVAFPDISTMIVTLKLAADDSTVVGPITVPRAGNTFEYQATGLDAETEYYWEWTWQATVNGVVVSSGHADYLGAPCESIVFETLPDVCLPVDGVTAEAEETA